jgi:hypothetical protein
MNPRFTFVKFHNRVHLFKLENMFKPNYWLMGLFCLLSQIVSAQPNAKRENKWQETIDGLEKTEVIQKYIKAKENIEKQMTDFHRQKSTLNPNDVEEIRKGYDASVGKFDKILEDLKKDFMSAQARKIMNQSPDRFVKYYNGEVDEAVRFYGNNCNSKIEALLYADGGGTGITEVMALIGLASELVKIIDKWQDKVQKMSGDYFDNNFIQKLRLKKWDAY